MLLAGALACQERARPVRALLLPKGDNPDLAETYRRIMPPGLFAGLGSVPLAHLDKTITQYLSGRDWLLPAVARRRSAGDRAALVQALTDRPVEQLLVGNRHHAPERVLLAAAGARGLPTGLIEEGLSLYQTREYWEPGAAAGALRRLAYAYQGVPAYYGRPRTRFDVAWLSCPDAYPHADVAERRPLASLAEALREAAAEMARFAGLRRLARDLPEGAALLLSQRLSEDGLVTRETEIAVLAEAAELLSEGGRPVLFKAHPRDSFDKAGAIESRLGSRPAACLRPLPLSGLPVELLFADWRPSIVVGLLSATLVYAPALFGIPAYTLAGRLTAAGPGLERFRTVIERCGIAPFEAEGAR